MNKKVTKKIKIIITIIIVALFVWFLVLSPYITFKRNEKTLEEAAKRYYELNSEELPTGERLATVTLQTLYYKAFVKEDFYIPNTKEPCSITESWVKVKKEDGKYKYYTYLKCGVLSSNIDHKGPKIILEGKEKMTVDKGSEFKDPGISSVVDNKDGKLEVKDVVVKGKVDTNKVGTYEITYTALDTLKNKTTVTRTVEVVERIKNTVELATNETNYYVGANPNNYIYFSGMLFRMVGLDGDNVKIIADKDIANVNYAGINDWLEYYYDHLTKGAKKLIVDNKYCNMNLTDTTLDTTECTEYTKKKKVHIASIIDVNRANANDGNYLKPQSMSWLANKENSEKAYVVRDVFFGDVNQTYLSENQEYNYGVRPILTIKGKTLVKSGTGTKDNPYSLGETKKAKEDDLINTRHSGEYVKISGMLWRIVETNKNGTTKVISDDTLKQNKENITTYYQTSSKAKIYNPKEKGNVGYYINNKASEFVDTSYFVNQEIEVPIYKDKISYGKETETKKYKVKLSAPNMYDMFSAFEYEGDYMQSYWLINSSKEQYTKGVISDIGVVLIGEVSDYTEFGVRVVGNLNKKVIITKGAGTKQNPYIVAK